MVLFTNGSLRIASGFVANGALLPFSKVKFAADYCAFATKIGSISPLVKRTARR